MKDRFRAEKQPCNFYATSCNYDEKK